MCSRVAFLSYQILLTIVAPAKAMNDSPAAMCVGKRPMFLLISYPKRPAAACHGKNAEDAR